MDFLQIEGKNRISGNIRIAGSKNSALPLIASTILAKNEVTITNIPPVVDIKTLLKLLENLGAEYKLNGETLKISTQNINKTTAVYDIVRKMRASVLVLGPLLARFGQCEVSLPGGCAIGTRPIDLHLKALEKMGAEIDIRNGYVHASAPNGLTGTTIFFEKITVTGTENIVMAAALAKGKTEVFNSAKEPEVVQTCEILRNAGVKIEGIGTDHLIIHGTDGELLEFKEEAVIPDRIEAGTYLTAGAIMNSNLTIENANTGHLISIIDKLREMGFDFTFGKDSITLIPAKEIKPVEIITKEYPGFPTDMQAQFMALATQANGTSLIEETLFENRFMHVSELQRLGASMSINKNTVSIKGGVELFGADVMATDLRASSALVLAGLVANGTTKIHRIYHLDRGYVDLESKLNSLGAKISRGKE
jgi:UDP-N-acetylglucosamine 1-carboxyvinyltransferase